MAKLNVGEDPINPAYYAGTACAEIIEHMPTNVGFAFKYAWRLGEKDAEIQEAKKAIWYLKRETVRLKFNPISIIGFQEFAYTRIREAMTAGKLDNWQYNTLRHLLNYVRDWEVYHLNNAIAAFYEKVSEYVADNK